MSRANPGQSNSSRSRITASVSFAGAATKLLHRCARGRAFPEEESSRAQSPEPTARVALRNNVLEPCVDSLEIFASERMCNRYLSPERRTTERTNMLTL